MERSKNIETKNGIIGLAVGNAMGAPTEGQSRVALMRKPIISMQEIPSWNMPKGAWSAETSMTLATIDAINNDLDVNTKTIAQNLINWANLSKYTPYGQSFGIGNTTKESIERLDKGLRHGILPEECGGTTEMDNGNGSLIRMLPIAYYCLDKNLNDDEIVSLVRRVSSITHKHRVTIMGCYIYIKYAIELLKGQTKENAYINVRKANFSMFPFDTRNKYERILKKDIGRLSLNEISSKGYIVTTLESVFWILLNTASYNQAIIGAINLGEDTSAIASIVGGLAGILYGIRTINSDWKIDLKRYNYIKKLCEKFDNTLEFIRNNNDKDDNANNGNDKENEVNNNNAKDNEVTKNNYRDNNVNDNYLIKKTEKTEANEFDKKSSNQSKLNELEGKSKENTNNSNNNNNNNNNRICEKFSNNDGKNDQYKKRIKLTNKGRNKLEVIRGDITKLDVDCIVNAANESLVAGGGVDGAIHKAAGEKLDAKCKELIECKTGQAKITRGYNLLAKYIVHTVAPIWFVSEDEEYKKKLLRDAYVNAFKLAKDFDIETIAFPCLGMGVYAWPLNLGCKIAMETAVEFANREYFKKIILVCYESNTYEKYREEYKKCL